LCARIALLALLLIPLVAAASGRPASPLGAWAVIVVAGDDHASHTDNLTETFDNARRDVARVLAAKGFASDHIRQFSLRPERYPDTRPARSDIGLIARDLADLTRRAPGGCLIYFTSHGSPDGIVVGEDLVSPRGLAAMVDGACGARPTVVVISACFSGVFVPALEGANRLILTAARRDRSSFGCSESDRYPFFDTCMLQVLPGARSFLDLGPALRTCVAERERGEDARPPSGPQTWVGPGFARLTPGFDKGPSRP
jgi:hypothetical protein